jgi:hypothetical protein
MSDREMKWMQMKDINNADAMDMNGEGKNVEA